ncbi:MAG: methylmalonyl-CoA mutase family protein [Pseudomonadota bacterium]
MSDGVMERWHKLADRALKGAPRETLDADLSAILGARGSLTPFAPAAPPRYAGRPTGDNAAIVQPVHIDGAAATARADLTNGATGLALVFAGARPGHIGLTINTVDDLDQTLDGVSLDLIDLHIDAGDSAPAALALLLTLCERRGTLPRTLHAALPTVSDAIDATAVAGTRFVADGAVAAEAGLAPAEELAVATLHFAEILREGLAAGHAAEAIAARTSIRLGASADVFVTLAKVRAMRAIHALLGEGFGFAIPAEIHAIATASTLAPSDRPTNLLRLTGAAMGAMLGGADSVRLPPFDGSGAPFGARMGRNISALLQDEGHIALLSDPAEGSGTLEALTDTLGEAAWALFKTLGEGAPGWRTAAELKTRLDAAKARPRTLIGVTKHPPTTPDTAPPPTPATPREGERITGPFAALMAAAKDGRALSLATTPAFPPLGAIGEAP